MSNFNPQQLVGNPQFMQALMQNPQILAVMSKLTSLTSGINPEMLQAVLAEGNPEKISNLLNVSQEDLQNLALELKEASKGLVEQFPEFADIAKMAEQFTPTNKNE